MKGGGEEIYEQCSIGSAYWMSKKAFWGAGAGMLFLGVYISRSWKFTS